MKRFIWLMFLGSIGNIYFLLAMESPKPQKIKNGGWFDTNQEVKITLNGKKNQIYKFYTPYLHNNEYYLGKCEKNGKAGFYKLVDEEFRDPSHFYKAIIQLDDNTEPIEVFWARQSNLPPNPTTLSLAPPNCTEFPLSARINFWGVHEQYEIDASEAYIYRENHSCPPANSYWGVWFTHTTSGKCLSGIAGMLMLYGAGRIFWDTQEHWKKGGAYIFALIKKMVAKKRKRRKKGQKQIKPLQESA